MILQNYLDASGKKINFENAALETTLEVSNQGVKLLTSKNLMQNNNFKGFVLRFASLPKDKILDDKIDIKVTVKTSKKTLQMSRLGVPVNPKNSAFGKVSLMSLSISPKVERWHSSTMNTRRFCAISSMS